MRIFFTSSQFEERAIAYFPAIEIWPDVCLNQSIKIGETKWEK
jgi:hypothetical protein